MGHYFVKRGSKSEILTFAQPLVFVSPKNKIEYRKEKGNFVIFVDNNLINS